MKHPPVAIAILLLMLPAGVVAQPRLSRDQPILPAELEAFVEGLVRQVDSLPGDQVARSCASREKVVDAVSAVGPCSPVNVSMGDD